MEYLQGLSHEIWRFFMTNVAQWNTIIHSIYDRSSKKMFKKHPAEMRNVVENFTDYLGFIQSTNNPVLALKKGYVHKEQKGMMAIDQKGTEENKSTGKKLTQIRLYVYPDIGKKEIHVLKVNTKQTKGQQGNDIHDCLKLLEKEGLVSIRKSKKSS